MTIYTESQLNAMNKTRLVEVTAELSKQLESATSGPLKSSDIEKRMLDLARQATSVRDNAARRQEQHKEALVKIQAETDLAKAKLELEYKSEDGLEAKELAALYADLEKKAKVTIADLSFGLEKAEIDTKAKIDALQEKLDTASAKYQEAIDIWEKKVADVKEASESTISKVQLDHKRKVEEITYDNKIALRDQNLEAAKQIAATHDSVVIKETDLDDLKSFKATDEKDILGRIDSAVSSAKATVFASEGGKYSALKASTDSAIALLQNDKAYLTASITALTARLADADAQIKLFPSQLEKAVAAAKADVTINQDNKK